MVSVSDVWVLEKDVYHAAKKRLLSEAWLMRLYLETAWA